MDERITLDDHRRRNGKPKSAHLDLIDPVRWHDQPIPERRWLVEGLIPDRNVTMLAGDGGVGKTLLALQLAAACALGRQWLGTPTKAVKALCVLCEDEPDEIHRRLAAICEHYQANLGDLENLAILARVGVDNALMTWKNGWDPGEETAFHIRILNLATDHAYQLVVLDSLHDFFAGNENARPQARQFIQSLRTIATEADGAVVVTAHPSLAGRSSGTGEAGSSKDGVVDPRVLDDHRTKAEPFMELLSRRRGHEKATKALIDAREKREDALPAYQDAKLVWEGAQRKRTNEIAGTLQPRQRAAVKATAAALEALSKAIASEQQVRAELRSMAPLPESAKLPDLSGDLHDMAISNWHSAAWHWSQKIQKLGVI